MKIRSAIDSFAKLIIEPNNHDFSTRKKIAAWAVSILVFLPFAASLHVFSYFWNKHRIKHAPDAAPKVNQLYQDIKPKNPEQPLPPQPAQQPLDGMTNLNDNKMEKPNMNVGNGPYYPLHRNNPVARTPGQLPAGRNLSTRMVDFSGLNDEKTAHSVLANAGVADTYFLFDSNRVDGELQKLFTDYLSKAKDDNLKKNGAYILVPLHDQYDNGVYYHYLTKALQDQGKDVYFIVLQGPFTQIPSSRIVSQGIQLENNQADRAWHPYYLQMQLNQMTYEISELKAVNSPTGPFTKFPRITGWSRHTETFSWDGNQSNQNSPKIPAVPSPAPAPNPQPTPVMPQTYYPLAPNVKPFATPTPTTPQPVQAPLKVSPQAPVALPKKVIDIDGIRDPESMLKFVENIEKADTYFFARGIGNIGEDLSNNFLNYIEKSQDPHLTKKAAYILDLKTERYDHNVYYHYLIKALQEKGFDVYFVVLFTKEPSSSILDHRLPNQAVQFEGNREDFWHPYHLGTYFDAQYNKYIKPMADYPPNRDVRKIPKILGWTNHSITF